MESAVKYTIISNNTIYTEHDMKDIEKIKEYIRKHQSEKRYIHTCGVAADCERLAEIFDLSADDTKKLCIAGWLHDITKEFAPNEHKALFDEFNISKPVNSFFDPTVHSYSGAYYAKKLFPGIVDGDIFSAIYNHTTGRRGMSLFDMLVCFADYIEPSRRYEGSRRLRHEFYSGITKQNRNEFLYKCLIQSFDMTITSLINGGEIIDPDTIDARNYLIEISGIQPQREVTK